MKALYTSRRMTAFIVAVCVAVIAGCGGGGGADVAGPTSPAAPQVGSVAVTLPVTTLQVGATATATAEVKSTTGTTLSGRAVSWSSSNNAYATVSDGGVITGVAPGQVSITATSEGRTGTVILTVTPAPVNSVTLTLPSTQVIIARTVQSAVILRDERNAVLTGRTVSYTSSNVGVATVDAAGLITGVGSGNATITATSEGKSATAELRVVPAPVSSITLTLPSAQLSIGRTAQAVVVLRDDRNAELSGRAITFASSNAEVATVSATGLVSALANGTATITVSAEGKSATAELRVAPPPVNSVTVTLALSTLPQGGGTVATAVLRDDLGAPITGRDITWSSSDPQVAAVLAGNITAVTPGTATITATSEGKSGSAVVTVVRLPVAAVSVSLQQSTILIGTSTQALAILRDAGGNTLTGRAVQWGSSNPAVASVGANGQVTAVGIGTVAITATSEGQTGQAQLTVSPPVARVTLTGPTRVKVGDGYSYTATARAADGTVLNRPLTWSVRETSRATVTQAGSLTPLSAGAFTLVVTVDGVAWELTLNAYDWRTLVSGETTFELLEADAQISNRFGSVAYPELVVSCGSGTFFVWVRTPHVITHNGIIAYSLDGGASVGQTWQQLSPEYVTLWVPGGNSAVKAFASMLALVRRFYFAFGEYPTNTTRFADFRVSGLAVRLPSLFAKCPSALKVPTDPRTTDMDATVAQMKTALHALGRKSFDANPDDARARAAAGEAQPTPLPRLISAWPASTLPPLQEMRRVRR